MDLRGAAAVFVPVAFLVVVAASYLRVRKERNRLQGIEDVRFEQLQSTQAALDRQKEVSKGMFDLLLAQQDATAILKEENARLIRELAMSEETIHVLKPARDPRGRYSCTI